MMITNFRMLPVTDLLSLQAAVEEEIKLRREQERELLIEEFYALAKARGFAFPELLQTMAEASGLRPQGKKRLTRKAPIKYQHPENLELVWSGRGKTPNWIKEWMAAVGNMAKLEVAALSKK